MTDTADDFKRAAAAEAIERVYSGMRLGLGTGSTVGYFLELLGGRLVTGTLRDVVGVATSIRTTDQAHALGIPLGPLHGHAPLDLTVDGADEVDPDLDLIKGLGGALLREKLVAQASIRFVVMVDESKEVERLGRKAPLPVEVVPFEWQTHVPFLGSLGAEPTLRTTGDGDAPFTTDNGNYVLDCRFEGGIGDAPRLADRLRSRAGVVETGLFLGMAHEVIVAGPGGVRVRRRGVG